MNSMVQRIGQWLESIDPGVHRRVQGLRLVTAYGIAAMLGALLYSSYHLSGGWVLSYLAAGFSLWASVSEGQATRWLSTRDLVLLNAAAVAGAGSVITLGPLLRHGRMGPEWILITGAFMVGYLKRFGITGAGIGSQIHIGQLLGYGTGLTRADPGIVACAGLIATIESVVPRLLSGPAEHPSSTPLAPVADTSIERAQGSRELRMGLQAAVAALVIVLVRSVIHLQESAWAITASTYVIAGSAAGTADRVRRRLVGTFIGVPLGIACVPIAMHIPLLAWILAAMAMIIYAMALPERYDIACAAYAFTLMVTLAVLGARVWETLLGGLLGVVAAKVILPLPRQSDPA